MIWRVPLLQVFQYGFRVPHPTRQPNIQIRPNQHQSAVLLVVIQVDAVPFEESTTTTIFDLGLMIEIELGLAGFGVKYLSGSNLSGSGNSRE